jgi:signal transduction histidine kinase
MSLKNIFEQLNIPDQCKKYGLSVWQCPQFLFLVMGIVIIIATLTIWAIGNRYIEDPQLVALIVLLVTSVLFIIAFIITRSFEKLAEANRMKTEFVKIVSHQLRSPLTNLSWTVDALLSGELGDVKKDQLEYLKILRENVFRMTELVKDLLTVSRIEEGALLIKRENVSLDNVVKELMSRFRPLAIASNVEISFSAAPDLPAVSVDAHQIETAVENLLDNAIRYIKGKGTIEIKIGRKEKNLYFSIKDSGVGIPKEDQKFIFQKFFRAGNAIRQQTQGSGLGLFITKSIIERSGGKIGFQSEENKGTTFWFTLPLI